MGNQDNLPFRKKIVKVSEITGKRHMMEIAVTDRQLAKWAAGMNIQDAMPNLTADEREFIMTGITPDEWDEYIKKPSEEMQKEVDEEKEE